jgi:hypothetical protein
MTSLSKTQLNAILSALDGQPRNPNSKNAALRRIARHATLLGVELDDLLATAAGLLDGRMSADELRAQLQPVESEAHEGSPEASQRVEDSPAAPQTAPEVKGGNGEPWACLDPSHADHQAAAAGPQSLPTGKRALTAKQQLLAACHAARHWLQAECDRLGETRPDDILCVLSEAIARAEGQPRRPAVTGKQAKPPRSDSKQARLIAMLQRGASISEMTREFGWLRHTCHGALAGLKKKRGLNIISARHADGERIYRVAAAAEASGTAA